MADNRFEANNESLSRHEVPEWYHDAKFGIFIHWTASSIPAYAPAQSDITALVEREGPRALFSHSPYSEWYWNSLRIEGSPVHRHHLETYGADYGYENFVTAFDREIAKWDPEAWAQLFKEIHARYVVLVTKHHDGFLLWPSATRHPSREGWHATRDVVGELTASVRARGLRMGYYYSGALDWSFTSRPITSMSEMITNGPSSTRYARYVERHYRELIDTHAPEVLWNDIAYPPRGDLHRLIADYYNQVEEGVINDRWHQSSSLLGLLLRIPPLRRRAEAQIARAFAGGSMPPPQQIHTDYSTPEYRTLKEISDRKWECVRGIGHSFGYNATEEDSNFLTGDELVHLLVDIVSKNGNLLLNIGPRADGSIPEQQLRPLRELGEWLGVYGEAIFGTRPWERPTCTAATQDDLRITRRGEHTYLIVTRLNARARIQLSDFLPGEGARPVWLATGEPLECSSAGNGCVIDLPARIEESPAHVIRM